MPAELGLASRGVARTTTTTHHLVARRFHSRAAPLRSARCLAVARSVSLGSRQPYIDGPRRRPHPLPLSAPCSADETVSQNPPHSPLLDEPLKICPQLSLVNHFAVCAPFELTAMQPASRPAACLRRRLATLLLGILPLLAVRYNLQFSFTFVIPAPNRRGY